MDHRERQLHVAWIATCATLPFGLWYLGTVI